ncbi:hypothetical protein EOL96_00255 [Candidatus Saccharibacteria bacterium]|nr:hypothetical protein [Candidatus Saccharibacteria bacterium]
MGSSASAVQPQQASQPTVAHSATLTPQQLAVPTELAPQLGAVPMATNYPYSCVTRSYTFSRAPIAAYKYGGGSVIIPLGGRVCGYFTYIGAANWWDRAVSGMRVWNYTSGTYDERWDSAVPIPGLVWYKTNSLRASFY